MRSSFPILSRWHQGWLCLSFLLVALLATGAWATPREADEHAAQASGFLDRQRPVDAWRSLLAAHAADGDFHDRHVEVIRQAAIDLNRHANRELERSEPEGAENAIVAATIMRRPESRHVVVAAFGEGQLASFETTARRILGMAHLRQGQHNMVRGRRQAAEESIRTAHQLLEPGEPGFAVSAHDLGVIQADKAREARPLGDEDVVEVLVVSSIEYFRLTRDAAPGEERYTRLGSENEQRLLSEFADIFAKYITEEEPPPAPQGPRSVSEFFEGDITQNFLALFREGGVIHENLETIITVVVAVGGFILVWWIIPGFVLGRLARKGNVLAGELRMRVKLLGPIALCMYVVQSTSFRRKDRKVAAENGCPHCGFRLDNPKDYEGFIYSTCPKCKGKIKPLFTLDGYLQQLADGLSSDVERVERGAESMERFVGREAVRVLVEGIITLGVRRRASDLHFEPGSDSLVVRQRIDGMMTEMIALPRSLSAAVVSAIKVESNLNIAEKRVPQDGKLRKIVDKVDIDIRVATSPSGTGEKASLRLLDIRSIQMDTRHLGMMPADQKRFDRAIEAPHGLILVSGPTGSGKTTTLYVALQKLKSTARNIISIEDPIEFQIPGITQMQVNVAQGLTFASGLRSILRQDPDIIMVGEIRDRETAEISVNSALTGHLVFSTLHTIDSAASVARLIDLGVSPRQFADALNLVIAQRLVRLVCSKCAVETEPDQDLLEELGITPENIGNYVYRKGTGCTVCNRTGFYRRSGVFEFLEPSERLRVALEKESLTTGEIREIAIQAGMKSLRMSALEYLTRGLVSLEEVIRVTK